MRNTLAIARKELSIYFTTPLAYVISTAMMLIASFVFLNWLERFQQAQEYARLAGWEQVPAMYRNLTDAVMVPLWGVMLVVVLFVAPLLSMRLFAEEKRQKTFELLMTAPVRPSEIVLGKYLGGLGVVCATLGLTIVFPLILSVFGASESGSALEWSTVLLGYGGLLLWGATCMAIGMFVSSLTESQMVAALLSFAVLLPWWLLAGLSQTAEEPLRSVLGHLSVQIQLHHLLEGALSVKALVFFASVIGFSVFLTHRSVEARRWA